MEKITRFCKREGENGLFFPEKTGNMLALEGKGE